MMTNFRLKTIYSCQQEEQPNMRDTNLRYQNEVQFRYLGSVLTEDTEIKWRVGISKECLGTPQPQNVLCF